MILSREQIDGIAQHHRHDVDLGRWDADELELIETARAYHDAMDEVERLRKNLALAETVSVGGDEWEAAERERDAAFHSLALRIAERDAARAELSALRERIAALHTPTWQYWSARKVQVCHLCSALGRNFFLIEYPCATVRLLEGDSDGAS